MEPTESPTFPQILRASGNLSIMHGENEKGVRHSPLDFPHVLTPSRAKENLGKDLTSHIPPVVSPLIEPVKALTERLCNELN